MSSVKKYYNLTLQSASYIASRYLGSSKVWGYPYSVGIELTNYCNLQCEHCASGSGISKREKGYMSYDLFEKIRRELSAYIIKTMFYYQGESMMHPDFFAMLKDAEDMGPVISTNGHFLDEGSCKRLAGMNIDKIIVSLDGIKDSSYLRYRKGGNIKQVLKGIELLSKELNKRKKGNKLFIQVLVNRYNENELDQLADYASGLGVKISFKSMQLNIEPDGGGFLPANPRYRRYKLDEGRLLIRSRKPDYCYRLWTNPVITWDGKVLPCCFDKDADYVLGDLNKQTFKEIWTGKSYRAFRNRLLSMRAGIDICNNCTEGLDPKIKT